MSILVVHAALALVALTLTLQAPKPAAPAAAEPRVIAVQTSAPDTSAELMVLIESVRRRSDVLVVLSGGASKMTAATQRDLLAMFAALGTLAKERRIAVGDGGTRAGIMEAAGTARRDSGRAFPLIGVTPAREIPPLGTIAIDPNHSHIVAVNDPAKAKDEASFGSETAPMYWLFGRIAEGRPSVAIVANGGGIALKEIAANVDAGRRIILIEGSGRATDAVIALVRGTAPGDDEGVQLQTKAREAKLHRRPELFTMVPIGKGAPGLLEALRTALGPAPATAK